MQRLEVSGAVGPIYGSLGVKRLKKVLEMVSLASEEGPHRTNKLFLTHQTSLGENENRAFRMLLFRMSLV